MARRRSVARRAGAGPRISPAILIAITLIIAALVALGFHFGNRASSAGDDAATAAANAAGEPVRATGNVFDNLVRMWNANERIEELEKQNRDLQAWRALAERLAERNARYEALLRMPEDAFGAGADIENAIAAQLVLDSGGPFTRTLVANAGADHGVKAGYIAVNERGLVGRIVSVGRRSARVLMLDDYNSRIPVMGEASRVRAVLAGQATQQPNLLLGPAQTENPRLDFIVGAASLREGERMVTSGDGGLYPRGIHVGEARRGSDGVWRVALAASKGPIDFVRIIPYVGVEAPEDTLVEGEGPPPTLRSGVVNIVREQPQSQPQPPPAQRPTQQPVQRNEPSTPPPTQTQNPPANAGAAPQTPPTTPAQQQNPPQPRPEPAQTPPATGAPVAEGEQ